MLKPQEKINYCVCSVLQAIFKTNNINVSQDEIAKNLEPTENGFFTDGKIITDYLKQKGFDYIFHHHNQTPYNEPDTLLKEMEIGKAIIGVNDHVYFFIDFEDPFVYVIDPKDNSENKIELSNLRRDMAKHKSGFFGLVKKLNE